MANATADRLGQINGVTGSWANDNALFLKLFAGEILTAFNSVNVFMDKHTVRSISAGKQSSFPATWRATAAYHTPGAELVGQAMKHGERVLSIDDMLIADIFLAQIDELKNHYDVRSEYAKQMALALSNQFDRTVAQLIILGARQGANLMFTGQSGGSTITDADANTNAASLRGSIFQTAINMDDKLIPDHPRYVAMRPLYYYMLIQSDASFLLNRDIGGAGGVATAQLPLVCGMSVVKSTQVPSTNVTGTFQNKYNVDASNVVAIAWTPQAVGTVKLLDVSTEAEWDIRRQGTLMLAKMAVGSDFLRPECCADIKTA